MTRSLVAGAVGALLAGTAIAAPAPLAAAPPAVGPAVPVQAASATGRDDEAACSRARRRLWIEGEGWFVRRITTCR